MNGNQTTAFIGLGANIGDRKKNLNQAIEMLKHTEGIEVAVVSSYLNTAPVGYTEQPDFLNAVVELRTYLPPHDLLAVCSNIESVLKRERDIRWGPRTIDLDILLYGDLTVNHENLIIPHPRMHEREFVLKPLNEISPQTVHPVFQKTISDLYQSLHTS